MLVALVGLAFIGGGAFTLRMYSKARTYVRVAGVVVDRVESFSSGSESGNRMASPIFEFVDNRGQTIRKKSGSASYPWPEIGKNVTILYDPADPEGTAEIVNSANSTPWSGSPSSPPESSSSWSA
jgi:hypothetical protein